MKYMETTEFSRVPVCSFCVYVYLASKQPCLLRSDQIVVMQAILMLFGYLDL